MTLNSGNSVPVLHAAKVSGSRREYLSGSEAKPVLYIQLGKFYLAW